MKLTSRNFSEGEYIPGPLAFAVPDTENHFTLSSNLNPQLSWNDTPQGTESFVILCHDPDVPSVIDDVNQEGKVISASLPRVDFYHWLLWNIPANVQSIEEGAQSSGVTPKGKGGPEAPQGFQHGINNYTDFMAGNPDMAGTYFGYDGPCPPWNDELVHRYTFTVYAIDAKQLSVEGEPTSQNVLAALGKVSVLGKASLTGLYTLNDEAVEPMQ